MFVLSVRPAVECRSFLSLHKDELRLFLLQEAGEKNDQLQQFQVLFLQNVENKSFISLCWDVTMLHLLTFNIILRSVWCFNTQFMKLHRCQHFKCFYQTQTASDFSALKTFESSDCVERLKNQKTCSVKTSEGSDFKDLSLFKDTVMWKSRLR